jgi:DNA-binding LytR/AlgR family response regulator
MRKSRVLLAGVAVAAAAAATSAFTAGNDLSAAGDSVLGYGQVHVTGATVTAIDYNVDPLDNSVLTDIVFTTSTTITTETGQLTLTDDTDPLAPVVEGVYSCVLGGTAPAQTFTCATTAKLADFNTVGLTVASA